MALHKDGCCYCQPSVPSPAKLRHPFPAERSHHSRPMALSLSPSLARPAAAASSRSFPRPAAPASCIFATRSGRRPRGAVVAMADLLGDLGARDPFPEEIESNFGEKVLGDVDTLHRILIPTLSALSLARLPLQPDPEPLSVADARQLLFKVVGWRLVLSEDGERPERLQTIWKVRDEACGQELIARIAAKLQGADHRPAVLLFEAPSQVRVELSSTTAAGDGLTVNDFIIGARIDKVKTLDLIPKKRVWA